MLKTQIYLYSDKNSNWELGEKLGLSGDALMCFRHALSEVEIEIEVDESTGLSTIIACNGRTLAPIEPMSMSINKQQAIVKLRNLFEEIQKSDINRAVYFFKLIEVVAWLVELMPTGIETQSILLHEIKNVIKSQEPFPPPGLTPFLLEQE